MGTPVPDVGTLAPEAGTVVLEAGTALGAAPEASEEPASLSTKHL